MLHRLAASKCAKNSGHYLFQWYYGPEFSSNALDAWAFEHGVQIEFTRPGKPTDNGHIETVNGKFRDECLNQNVFLSLHDARERLRLGADYNQRRPHSSLGWLTPEEFREKNITCNPLGTTNI
ncbi:transposase [Desulfovibrio desulfuricans]|uniref:Transposase n=1 Tax=Desulfovibrio desulfuricans TaxID=876 RepID=A0A4P7UID2_DESDE|nr:transposase [Desulfovibrio desulfuricans]